MAAGIRDISLVELINGVKEVGLAVLGERAPDSAYHLPLGLTTNQYAGWIIKTFFNGAKDDISAEELELFIAVAHIVDARDLHALDAVDAKGENVAVAHKGCAKRGVTSTEEGHVDAAGVKRKVEAAGTLIVAGKLSHYATNHHLTQNMSELPTVVSKALGLTLKDTDRFCGDTGPDRSRRNLLHASLHWASTSGFMKSYIPGKFAKGMPEEGFGSWPSLSHDFIVRTTSAPAGSAKCAVLASIFGRFSASPFFALLPKTLIPHLNTLADEASVLRANTIGCRVGSTLYAAKPEQLTFSYFEELAPYAIAYLEAILPKSTLKKSPCLKAIDPEATFSATLSSVISSVFGQDMTTDEQIATVKEKINVSSGDMSGFTADRFSILSTAFVTSATGAPILSQKDKVPNARKSSASVSRSVSFEPLENGSSTEVYLAADGTICSGPGLDRKKHTLWYLGGKFAVCNGKLYESTADPRTVGDLDTHYLNLRAKRDATTGENNSVRAFESARRTSM